MKRILTLALCAAFLVMAGTAMAKTLKVGSMSPLTGPYAADGNDIANGARTAIEVMKADGGIPGYDDIELLPQDTACDPRQSVAAANKLINEEVSGVVGAYCSSATIPASETLDEESIIMITPASTSPVVTERGLQYMFRTCGRDDAQAPSALKFISGELGAKTIYIVDDKTTYSQGIADQLEKIAPASGVTVLGHDHINQGDKDFSAILTKVKAAKPDLFYISLQNSATGALMVIQAKRMGLDATLMGQDAVYHPQLIDIAGKDSEGMYLTFGYTDVDSPAYKKFIGAYKPKYGDPGAYSAYAYDSMMAYLMAVKKAGSTDSDAVRKAIIDTEFDGASKKIDYQGNGDSGSNYVIRKVEGGKFINYWNPATGQKF